MIAAMTFIAFSKDRPLQLLGLLESLDSHIEETVTVFVIYHTGDDQYYLRYREIFARKWNRLILHPVPEFGIFKNHLLDVLGWCRTKAVSFLVDDIVFVRDFSVSRLVDLVSGGGIVSLRLGKNISYSYMLDRQQKIPDFRKVGKFLSWIWKQGEIDWNYPMSVDGNIFLTREIIAMIQKLDFKNPSQLEEQMNHQCAPWRKRRGYCFPFPVLVNIPANKVQNELPGNRSGSSSLDDFKALWDGGQAMDVAKYNGHTGCSVHEELELYLKPRTGSPA